MTIRFFAKPTLALLLCLFLSACDSGEVDDGFLTEVSPLMASSQEVLAEEWPASQQPNEALPYPSQTEFDILDQAQSAENCSLCHDPAADIEGDYEFTMGDEVNQRASFRAIDYPATTCYWPLRDYKLGGYDFGTQTGSNRYHLGEDAKGAAGTSVYAAANGRVMYSGTASGYGGIVVVESYMPSGTDRYVRFVYGHLNPATIPVSVGWDIGRGRYLGKLGTSAQNGGWAPHLHFGVRKGNHTGAWQYQGYGTASDRNNWLDPTNFIQARLPKPFDAKPLPLWVSATNWGELPKSYYQKYYFTATPGTTVTVNVAALSGNPDLYVSSSSDVSPTSSQLRSVKSGSDKLTFKVTSKVTYLAVHAKTAASWEVSLR